MTDIYEFDSRKGHNKIGEVFSWETPSTIRVKCLLHWLSLSSTARRASSGSIIHRLVRVSQSIQDGHRVSVQVHFSGPQNHQWRLIVDIRIIKEKIWTLLIYILKHDSAYGRIVQRPYPFSVSGFTFIFQLFHTSVLYFNYVEIENWRKRGTFHSYLPRIT